MEKKTLDDLMQQIGPNKVIGHIVEIPEYVQNYKSEHQHCSVPDHLRCPYDIFKEFQSKNDNYKTKNENENENEKNENMMQINDSNIIFKEKDEKGERGERGEKQDKKILSNHDNRENKNKILEQILLLVEPLASLYSQDMMSRKVELFKKELALHLEDDKDYYRKMGFSRKKGCSLGEMKKQLLSPNTDGKLSDEVLLYLCKVSNIDLIIIDMIKEERKEILCQNAKVDYTYIIQCPDKNGNTSYKLEIDKENTASNYIFGLIKEKENLEDVHKRSVFLSKWSKMKYNDKKKWVKFIEGDEFTKKKKKDDIDEYLKKKIEEV